jgi:hypothetical protein
MKLTRHNGRSGKNGTYNPKHNDRRFDIANSEHIDQERAKHNVYWDCYQGARTPSNQSEEDQIAYSFEQIEKAFYSERYDDYCEGQHERNRKTGHTERDRTPMDLWQNKKTCPEESLIQIGTMEQSVPPAVLGQIAAEFFKEFDRRFGEHIHILDWALHLDEATPHIHERHVFDFENAYGEIQPQQDKALEALGFDLPHPDQKKGKLNNRKMTFDAACRTMLFDICAKHGLHLDQEPEYGGRAYLEKQDYILMKQKEKLADQDKQIESKDAKLEELTIRIEDTEAFIEEVADAAYEKAVDVVTKTVLEEVRNEDFDLIAEQRRLVLNNAGLSDAERNFAGQIFRSVMNVFKGMTQYISDKMAFIFRTPEKKAVIKEPIKESIRDRLARNKIRADEANRRRWEQQGLPQRRQSNRER